MGKNAERAVEWVSSRGNHFPLNKPEERWGVLYNGYYTFAPDIPKLRAAIESMMDALDKPESRFGGSYWGDEWDPYRRDG